MKTASILATVAAVAVVVFSALGLSPTKAEVLPTTYQPWIVFGQTVLAPNSAPCDPVANHPGTLGEASFPYTVPAGKVLVINRGQVEALWGAGLILYFNSACSDNTKASHTISGGPVWTVSPGNNPAGATHDEVFGPYYIPAGMTVHLRLSSNETPSPGWAYGWMVSGYLMPAQ